MMDIEKNIREELLKQNGAGAQKMQELRDKILARDEARVARMKRLTILTWGIIVLMMVIAFIVHLFLPHVREPDARSAIASQYYSSIFIGFVWCLTTIAMFFTISLFVRWRALTMRQLQARLAGIEEQLKRIAEKE